MVVLGCADGGFQSVQMGLDVLHVHRVLAATHLQDQLTTNQSNAITSADFQLPFPAPALNLRLLLTLALRPMMS